MNKAQIGVSIVVGEADADAYLDHEAAQAAWMELNHDLMAEHLALSPELKREDGAPYDLDNPDDFDEVYLAYEEESIDPTEGELRDGALHIDEDDVRQLLRVLILRWGRAEVRRLLDEAVDLVANADVEKMLGDMAYAYVLAEREEDYTNEGVRTLIKRYVSYEQIEAARVQYERTEKEEAEDDE